MIGLRVFKGADTSRHRGKLVEIGQIAFSWAPERGKSSADVFCGLRSRRRAVVVRVCENLLCKFLDQHEKEEKKSFKRTVSAAVGFLVYEFLIGNRSRSSIGDLIIGIRYLLTHN